MILIPNLYDLFFIHLCKLQCPLDVLRLHPMIIDQRNFRLYGNFNVITTFHHVYMYWFMIIGKKEEPQPKNLEYRRHTLLFTMIIQK